MPESFKYDNQAGKGGELHQTPSSEDQQMTTAQGCPIADDQNSLRAGKRGPGLLEDHIMREKIFHFDHERIPERVVHARGFGAHGYFETYDDFSDLTSADLFQRKGEKTPVFARFSTVAGNMGSPDLARDVRGFAVKFYTQEGNWDLVGNNIPVFFIQDAMKFPDLIHAAKQEPDRGFPQAQTAHDNFWDFVSLSPESVHMLMWAMSDRAIPRSLRFMEGFGVHTFRLVNARGIAKYVKFHWKPVAGMQSVTWNEALKINGADPDFHRKDMWQAIQAGDFPEWELGVQVFDDEFADKFEFDVLDATKLIPEEQIPIKKLGKMVLNKTVDNFFAETEQAAFCTQNIVPGLDFTNDPLLQGRNFSYLDTQTKRLGGPNFTHIPINAPKCPMRHFQQDGHMAMTNPKGRANYEPNSWTDQKDNPRACKEKGFESVQDAIDGDKLRYRSETFADHYSQALQFYRSQTDTERMHIQNAFIFELSKVETQAIRERMVSHLLNVDGTLAKNVAKGLGLPEMPEKAEAALPTNTDLPESDALSIMKNAPQSFKGRKLGILCCDAISDDELNKLTDLMKEEGAMYEIVAPTVQGITTKSGQKIKGDQKIEGGPSVLYDAVAVLLAEDALVDVINTPEAKDFIMDAHAHSKFVIYNDCAKNLFDAVNLSDAIDEGYLNVSSDNDKIMKNLANLRYWAR